MIQKETNLVVADNSGARSVRAFTLYGGSFRKTSSIGDIIKCSVKDATPNGKVKKGDVVRCVIVRTKNQDCDCRKGRVWEGFSQEAADQAQQKERVRNLPHHPSDEERGDGGR